MPMNGMNATTGKPLSGSAHLAQSVADILSTPIGSRIMRRDYGSAIPALIDSPINRSLPMLLRAAAVDALRQWETRLTVSSVSLSGDPAKGGLTIAIAGQTADTAQPATLSVSIPAARAA